MKKLLSLIIALVLLPIVALADLDVAGMTDQELKDMIAACSAELMTRNKTEPEGILIFEYEGVKVYQIGDAEIDSNYYMHIPVAVYNDMDYEVIVSPDKTTCNGWEIYDGGCSAAAKAKRKDDISFKISDADVTSLDQIDSFRFIWSVFNNDAWENIYKSEPEEHRFW